MHELRSDMSYRAIVDELIIVPEASDTRDTEAVKRIATAYLKLLFPHVRNANDITAR
jgi:ATP-dependent Lon protease